MITVNFKWIELGITNFGSDLEACKAKGVMSLPGGWKNYVIFIIKSLKKIDADSPSRSDFINWMKKEFNLTGQIVTKWYLHTLFDLELTEDYEGGVKLSKIGQEFLRTRDTEIILLVLLKNFAGFVDILALLYSENASLEKIHKKLLITYNFGWKTDNQTNVRLKWLMALGYVNALSGKEFGLTVKGIEFVKKSGEIKRD